MKISKNQQGSSLVIVVAVICLAAALIGIGMYMMNKNRTASRTTSPITDTTKANPETQSGSEQTEIETAKNQLQSPQGAFGIAIPKDWNYRFCSSYDGIVFLVPGGDGTQNCVQSDAKYPEDGWRVFGKVVIAVGENGYTRPDDARSSEVSLANGITAVKNVYNTRDKSVDETVTVTEYIIRSKKSTITAKAFSSASISKQYPEIDPDVMIKQLETALGTLIFN